MIDVYALEAYCIPETPWEIAFEANIEAQLGNGRFAHQERRLAAAVKRGDMEEAAQIKAEIEKEAEELKRQAKKERNLKIARIAIGLAGTAISIAGQIIAAKNAKDENKLFTDLLSSGKGATSEQLRELAEIKSRGGDFAHKAGILNTLLGFAGNIVG